MKTLLTLVTLLYSTQSFALVAEKADCQTSDGKYQIYVFDNQGIGFPRVSHLGAVVRNAKDQIVASYGLTFDNPRIRSVSFGTSAFEDTDTQGEQFTLTTGSTNFGPRLHVKLNEGKEEGVIDDANVSCQFYGLNQLPLSK